MTRSSAFGLVGACVLLAGVASCGGSEKETAPPPSTTTQAATPAVLKLGELLFTEQGCLGCHSLKALNNEAQNGPDLDRLPEYAEKAGKPLASFIRESIVDPNVYIEEGFIADRMPPYFGDLPKEQIDALVAFLLDATAT